MEPDAFFENASVGDFSIGSRLTGWEGFEEAGLELVGVGFEGMVFEQAFLDGFKDASAYVVVGDLRVERPRVFGGGAVPDEPRRSVGTFCFERGNIRVVRTTGQKRGDERGEKQQQVRGAAHRVEMKAKRKR
jgi:hypothetical protein